MSYYSTATHNAIIANPTTYVPSLYASYKASFVTELGTPFASLSDDLIKMAYATMLAFDMKPYGNSNPTTLAACLAATDMNCDNYCIFAGEFARILGAPDPAMVGWNGGAVGNHAQLLATSGSRYMLCDPTVGFMAIDVTLDGLGRGYGPNTGYWKSFLGYHGERTDMVTFGATVKTAVLNGTYKASDILYYAPDIDDYRALGGSSQWATPQSWNV